MRWTLAALTVLALGGQAMADGCYSRTYTADHLRKNPNQTVRVLSIRFLDEGDGAADVKVVFRDGNRVYRERLFCWDPNDPQYGDAYLGCSVECDGGMFLARPRSADSILIETRGGFWVNTSCGEGGGMRQVGDIGAKKTVFRLNRASDRVCD